MTKEEISKALKQQLKEIAHYSSEVQEEIMNKFIDDIGFAFPTLGINILEKALEIIKNVRKKLNYENVKKV